jgi:hypothetical protein
MRVTNLLARIDFVAAGKPGADEITGSVSMS